MIQPGWALQVVGIHVKRLGHGQGVKEWTFQQARSEAPSWVSSPPSFLLEHLSWNLHIYTEFQKLHRSALQVSEGKLRFGDWQ